MAIAPEQRAVLHRRIEKRFSLMLELGLLDEVRSLRKRNDLHADLPAMRAVGYRQVWQYLAGELDYQEMIERGVIATRQLAKRQFTWLNGWDGLQWIHTDEGGLLVSTETTMPQVNGLQGLPALVLAQKYVSQL
jgi:tRNA dimethylallyltransferase